MRVREFSSRRKRAETRSSLPANRRFTVKRMRVPWPAVIVLLAVATARGETFTVGIDDLRDPTFWKKVGQSLEREPADVAIKDGAYTAVPVVSVVGVGHPGNTLTIRAASAGKVSFS